MKIAFLDSWLQTSEAGSGTAVAIRGLSQALLATGNEVEPFGLSHHDSDPAALLADRQRFNDDLCDGFDAGPFDVVVGFDIDGYRWAEQRGATPYVVSIKGVLAEEAAKERGDARRMLWAMAELEAQNARLADRTLLR